MQGNNKGWTEGNKGMNLLQMGRSPKSQSPGVTGGEKEINSIKIHRVLAPNNLKEYKHCNCKQELRLLMSTRIKMGEGDWMEGKWF